MALSEDLRRVYSKDTSYFGSAFNPRPEPDAFGRRDATPLEVIRATNGEFNLPKEQTVFRRKKRKWR